MTAAMLGVVPVSTAAAQDEAVSRSITEHIAAATPRLMYAATATTELRGDETYQVVELNARTGDVVRVVADLGATPVNGLAASPSGQVYAATSDGDIVVYRRRGGAYVQAGVWPVR